MSSVIQSSQSEIARRSIGRPSPLLGQGAGAGNAKLAGRPGAMPPSAIPPSGSQGLHAMAEEAEEEDDEFSEDDFDDDFDDDFEEDLDDDLKEFEETIENPSDDDDDDDAEVGEPFEEEDDF